MRVWLVERSYSDDEQNLIVLVYATRDGRRYLRKERALTSFDDVRETPVSLEVDPDRLATVEDGETRERYAAAVAERAGAHDPEETLPG
jgi:hypothetical protein